MHRLSLITIGLYALAIVTGQQLAVPFEYVNDIEKRSMKTPHGCESVVRDHFVGLTSTRWIGSADVKAHDAQFDIGVKMAWICTTIEVQRPCGILGLATCDKRSCFKSLSNGSERNCHYSNADFIGFKVVETSVLVRFQRDISVKQFEVAESTLNIVYGVSSVVHLVSAKVDDVSSAVSIVDSAVHEVGSAVHLVSAKTDDIHAKAEEVIALQNQMAERLAGIVECVHRVAALTEFIIGSIERIENRIEFVASVISRFMSDIISTCVDAIILYRANNVSDRIYTSICIAVYWLVFRDIWQSTFPPSWVIYIFIIKSVVKRMCRACCCTMPRSVPREPIALATPLDNSEECKQDRTEECTPDATPIVEDKLFAEANKCNHFIKPDRRHLLGRLCRSYPKHGCTCGRCSKHCNCASSSVSE